jgi:hypothetical protein
VNGRLLERRENFENRVGSHHAQYAGPSA